MLHPQPLQIGPVKLATNLLLAPIAGYCDLAFRLVVRRLGGVGMACTDLLCPEGVVRENRRSMQLAATSPEDSPLAMQLYGSDPQRLAEAARWAEDHGADVVDINMGCPVDKVTKRNGGSKLLCDPDSTLRLVDRVAGALRRAPLTCKLRLGWDESAIVAPQLARRLEEAGVAMITIHGRTASMKFSGAASLDGIAAVVSAVSRIPVIGNGDVRAPADAAAMIRRTGCAGIMIGRGALGTPWLLRDCWALLSTGAVPPSPTVEQIRGIIKEHFCLAMEQRGERHAVDMMRKRISWYARHLGHCPELREQMRQIRTAGEFERVLSEAEPAEQSESGACLAGTS